MSNDSSGAFALIEYLLGVKRNDEFILGYNISKIRALLNAQFEWLSEVELSYYDDPSHIAQKLHKLTKTEVKNKKVWLKDLKSKHGETVKVRALTDIEKAYLGYS
jgi:hypothetical protein